jgi:glycosyltransferase involved in cell wall biosynthesis
LRIAADLRAYRACAVLVATSEWLADELVAGGIPRDRVRVVTPGKDLDATPRPAGATDALLGVDHPALRDGRLLGALCVANWLPQKGILELLGAVAGLPDDVVTLHLVGDAGGDGAYARRVRERIERGDLVERVVVHGPVEPSALEGLYRAADVFVLSSVDEAYGTVWGEAMALGLPVIGWRSGNLPFLVDDGREGLLVPVGDIPGLGRAIESLARDPALRDRLGRAASVRAEARPTWDQVAERFFAIVHDVADGTPAS